MAGWKLVTLVQESYPSDPSHPFYISFAHYTGRRSRTGGSEYDKVLQGHMSFRQFMNATRKYLKEGPGNISREMSRL